MWNLTSPSVSAGNGAGCVVGTRAKGDRATGKSVAASNLIFLYAFPI